MGKRRVSRARRWYEKLADRDPCVFTAAMLDAMTTKEIGDVGESLAANYLHQCGFDLIEFNYRCPEGEADLIAFDPEMEQVVLVEVKTRRLQGRKESVYPEEAVTSRKECRYRRIATFYAMERFPVPSIRFDVVAVTLVPGCLAAFEHIAGAFDWEAER